MDYGKCPKCGGTGRIIEKDGSIHVCFDCLANGKFDQQHESGPNSKPLLRKINRGYSSQNNQNQTK